MPPTTQAASVNDQITAIFSEKAKQLQDRLAKTHPQLPQVVRRGAHPKHHGLVRGLFIVGADVPAELKVGLFAEPRAYPAYVRFSNAGSDFDDRVKDAHGMAIKLLDVPGKKLLPDEQGTHDFVLVDAPVFIAKSPEDFLAFMTLAGEVAVKTGEVEAARIAGSPDLPALESALAQLKQRMALQFPNVLSLKKGIVNPLFVPYFSQTAYRCGPRLQVKYKALPRRVVTVEPVSTELDVLPDPANYLSHAMAATLDAEEVVYDFFAQIGDGSSNAPTEDPTVEWNERDFPFRPVATLSVPRQKFTWPQQLAFAEHISFNPWHCLELHQPLGRVNEARRDVYLEMAKRRHAANKVTPREPNGVNDF